LIGGFNTVLDVALFTVLANVIYLHPILANMISTVIVMTGSFFLNYHFVFRSNERKAKSAVQFVAATLFNAWVVQSAIIWIAINVGDAIIYNPEMLNFLAKLCGTGVGMISNYLCYHFIFRHKRKTDNDVIK
jgi:putative flippase GtrA